MINTDIYVWYGPIFDSVAQCQQYAATNTIAVFNQLIAEFPGVSVEGLWCYPEPQLTELLEAIEEAKNGKSI
tara:strand:- start:769 stop:984 length:216 start_codon:yes stop_codon:yes gene_type:complete